MGRAFEEIVRKAEEWKKEICVCGNECYAPNLTPLIFPPLRQKILLISESPYNFPRKKGDPHVEEWGECKSLGEFLEKDLLRNLRDRATKEDKWRAPSDIFDFLYLTFRPVFSSSVEEEDVAKLLRCVYWTHAAKRSLRNFKGYEKYKAARKCRAATVRELAEISPEKIVVASSVALKVLFGKTYGQSSKKQGEKLEKRGELLTLGELASEASLRDLGLQDLRDCEVAVFPNPSRANGGRKSRFYIHEREVAEKVMGRIQQELKSSCG